MQISFESLTRTLDRDASSRSFGVVELGVVRKDDGVVPVLEVGLVEINYMENI